MRISLVTASARPSPRSAALYHSLAAAGHDLGVGRVEHRRLGRSRLVPVEDWGQIRRPDDRNASARPTVLFPDTSRMVEVAGPVAASIDAWVARRPDWPRPERDLAWAAPEHPELSVPAGGTPAEREPWNGYRGRPAPGRHTGTVVGLFFRSTPANPGRYLKAALERAGVTVVADDRLDFDDLPALDGVVVVESPDPPLEVVGENPGTPVVYWVHHGEHHLEANLRLTDRYGVDLVLLAHSWHLALRFDRQVERFPFAVDPSLADPSTPHDRRSHHAAFVGALTDGVYDRRRYLLDRLSDRVGSVELRSGVTPDEMGRLYSNARMVLNDGGSRHLPITMRVFEAIGSGALLVSERAPGLDLIFGDRYHPIDDPTFGDLPDAAGAAALASAALAEARDAHTYDHRVDCLLDHIQRLEHRAESRATPQTPLDRFLFDHPHSQRILDGVGLVHAPDREVWRLSDLRDAPPAGSFDTVVVDRDAGPELIGAARRFVVGENLDPGRVTSAIRSVSRLGGVTAIELDTASYHVDWVGDGRQP